MKMFQR